MEEFFQAISSLNITGRNLEITFPLLYIFHYFAHSELDEFLKIIKAIIQRKKDDEFVESRDMLTYDFIAQRNPTLEYTSLKELTTLFKIFVGEEEWVNEKWFGRALKRLNLILDKRRVASGAQLIVNVPKAKEKLRSFQIKEKER